MVINPPEELVVHSTTPEYRTSTEQVRTLVNALSYEQLSLKALMEKAGLKHRPTFLENYINPALDAGIVKTLYPDKPNHPKQKYLLTAKGLALHNEIKKIYNNAIAGTQSALLPPAISVNIPYHDTLNSRNHPLPQVYSIHHTTHTETLY